MVKRLQAMKVKKGFTLVELIVVIAIIGVLAAILVPTMLGFVQDSRITSANNTASQLKNNVTNWLTAIDTKGLGYRQVTGTQDIMEIDVNEAGEWTIAGLTAANFVGTYAGSSYETEMNTKGGNAGALVATAAGDMNYAATVYLQDVLSDVKTITARVFINGGKVIGVAVVPSLAAAPTWMGETDFTTGNATYQWGQKAGIFATGELCGTAPTITGVTQ